MTNSHDIAEQSGYNRALADVAILVRKMRSIRPGLGLLELLIKEMQKGVSLSDVLTKFGNKEESNDKN